MEDGEADQVVLPIAHTGTTITKIARPFATNWLAVEVGRKRAELEETNVTLSTKDRGWINRCVGMHTKTLSTSVLLGSVVLGISTVFGAFLVTGLSLTDAMDLDPAYTQCTNFISTTRSLGDTGPCLALQSTGTSLRQMVCYDSAAEESRSTPP